MKRSIEEVDGVDALSEAMRSIHITKRAKKVRYLGKFGIPLEEKPYYTHAEVEDLVRERDDILYEGYKLLMVDIATLKQRIHFLEIELALERRTCAIAFRTKEGI